MTPLSATAQVPMSSAQRMRRDWATRVFAGALAVAFAGFVALGVWQVQRMDWKHALIARVDARIHAEPVDPPARMHWAGVTEASDGYRRVRLSGHFLPGAEVRTQAVTALGAGAWVLTPLRTTAGDFVLVNRGFVPSGRTALAAPAGPVEVVGLLRTSEPGGGFLRRNAPAQGRWYSRDVAAIARALRLPSAEVAPFFVDAQASRTLAAPSQADGPGAAGAAVVWPRAGLTVVHFRDSHLSYALTWFGLALLTALAGWRVLAPASFAHAWASFVRGRGLRQDRHGRGGLEHAGPTIRH